MKLLRRPERNEKAFILWINIYIIYGSTDSDISLVLYVLFLFFHSISPLETTFFYRKLFERYSF